MEHPTPVPGPGQVLVKVLSAGVNFSDVKRRRDDDYPFPTAFPYTPGGEVAGTVEALGEGVRVPAVGTRVFALVGGDGSTGYAQYALADAAQTVPVPGDLDTDVALTLACCHPALSPEAQVALTLRHVVGMTDREVAARLLVAGPTLTKRLVRARAKIRDAGIGFEVPTTEHLPGRVQEVRTVVHLLFTHGYVDPAHGRELCEEAIWLGRQLHRMLPDDSETAALLALMLLHHSRWAARWVDGRLVPYDEQNRTLWDSAAAEHAKQLLAGVDEPGGYGLHAAIALLRAATEPRWPLIADLYTALARLDESPVVRVNRAVAVGRADGPQAGLAALAPLLDDSRVSGSVSLLAAQAELLERAGDPSADDAWRSAADAARNEPEREHLASRALRARGGGQ